VGRASDLLRDDTLLAIDHLALGLGLALLGGELLHKCGCVAAALLKLRLQRRQLHLWEEIEAQVRRKGQTPKWSQRTTCRGDQGRRGGRARKRTFMAETCLLVRSRAARPWLRRSARRARRSSVSESSPL